MHVSLARLAGAALCLLVLAAPGTRAQQLEPRAYANTPVGMNFLIAGYACSTGGLSTDPALPLDRQHSIKLYVSEGVSVRYGDDFNVAGLAWQHRWGGGL